MTLLGFSSAAMSAQTCGSGASGLKHTRATNFPTKLHDGTPPD
eukprot:CAMPEP_0179211086 /NCGR_PEP_ID=MMETSP0797-20121207/199_1 /TAXON_ID=47934 /ORGANISM="Dinophysis acuminata, Strain DAEP01" /LENGTH=42 /DNA_ID= /DNA_START= /DNA_END= /DNA_ORIENTATION=